MKKRTTKRLSAKKQKKVEEYQEYMRRSEEPTTLASIVTVLAIYQLIGEFTMSIKDDVLPVQRKRLEEMNRKLKPAMDSLSRLEDSYPYYEDMMNNLTEVVEGHRQKLIKHYRIQEYAEETSGGGPDELLQTTEST